MVLISAGSSWSSSPQWSWCAGPPWWKTTGQSWGKVPKTTPPLTSSPPARRGRRGGGTWRTGWWNTWVLCRVLLRWWVLGLGQWVRESVVECRNKCQTCQIGIECQWSLKNNMMVICHVWISFQNIRIMAKYYTRITMKRMAGLLDLSIDVSSVFLSGLLYTGALHFWVRMVVSDNTQILLWSVSHKMPSQKIAT